MLGRSMAEREDGGGSLKAAINVNDSVTKSKFDNSMAAAKASSTASSAPPTLC
jgi:S-adenosylhomocysteine hydrolase